MPSPADRKKSGIGIIHKGLAAILIPVIMQLACILWLYVLVQKAERLAAVEAKFSQSADLTSTIIMFASRVASARLKTVYTGQPDYVQLKKDSQRLNDLEQQLARTVDRSETIGVTPAMHEQLMTESRDCLKDLHRLMAACDVISTSDSSLLNRIALLQSLEPLMDRLHPKLEHFDSRFDEMHRAVTRARQEEATARDQMKGQIFTAVAIEVASTIALLFFFLKNIRDRLKTLIGNARLIPEEKPLTLSVPGSDELAYLDRVLHDAAVSLHLAAEHKRSLMEMVAHDLRSPMTSAQLLTEQMIIKSKKNATELTPQLEQLQRTCSLVIAFVEDLLTVDKLEAGELELNWDTIELKEVVQESLDQLSTVAQLKGVVLKENIEPVKILGDKRRLLQVFNNLVSNAIKYSPSATEVVVFSQIEGNKLKISIADRGQGIEKSKQAKLFDKFYQAEGAGSKQGFGLGLAICKLIVSAHNGTIGVDSEIGQGSTFWFTVPLDEDKEMAVTST